MNFTGVYHKTSEQMSYPKNEKELIINLQNRLRCETGLHTLWRPV